MSDTNTIFDRLRSRLQGIAYNMVSASITFGRDPVDGLFTLVADIRISLPDVDRAVAEELVRNTERICPYTKMARRGIECLVSLEP